MQIPIQFSFKYFSSGGVNGRPTIRQDNVNGYWGAREKVFATSGIHENVRPNTSPWSTDNHKHVPDSKVHGANMGHIWGRQDPGGPHVGHMNFAIWGTILHARDSQRQWTISIISAYSIYLTHLSQSAGSQYVIKQWKHLHRYSINQAFQIRFD